MHKQHGFIQGALLIGIALLAVVIGAFAMASNNNTSDTSKEKAKTNAAVVVKKFADAFEQYQITSAQKTLDAADTAITATAGSITLPQGFTGAQYAVADIQAGDKAVAQLFVTVSDPVSCAAINRILGLSTDTSDQVAIEAGASNSGNPLNESCYTISGGKGGDFVYSYFRKFRG